MSDIHAVEAEVEIPQVNESEEKARRLGWVPKDEFRGDPEHWRSADDFLARGEQLLPILKRDNDKLHRRLGDLEKQLKEQAEASKELLEFTSKSEQRAYERARADIESRIKDGAANADTAVVEAGMRELSELDKQHQPKTETKVPEQARQQIDPTIQAWIDREKWFTTTPSLAAFATEVYGELDRDAPGMAVEDRLAEVKKRTMDKFPEKFGINPKRNGAAHVDAPNTEIRKPKRGKTYEDLPADAKAACDRFMKSIPGYTRDKYVAAYDWDN